MIKKSVLEKLGYYDEDLAYEDLDLWVRTSRIYEFEYIPELLIKKRILASSLSSFFTQKKNPKTKKLHKSSLKILHKAVVTMLFPTLELVPCNIMLKLIISPPDSAI